MTDHDKLTAAIAEVKECAAGWPYEECDWLSEAEVTIFNAVVSGDLIPLAELQSLRAERDAFKGNADDAYAKWLAERERAEAAEAKLARVAEALSGSVLAMRSARGVIVSKHEHALLTGALVRCAEATAGVALEGAKPAAPEGGEG